MTRSNSVSIAAKHARPLWLVLFAVAVASGCAPEPTPGSEQDDVQDVANQDDVRSLRTTDQALTLAPDSCAPLYFIDAFWRFDESAPPALSDVDFHEMTFHDGAALTSGESVNGADDPDAGDAGQSGGHGYADVSSAGAHIATELLTLDASALDFDEGAFTLAFRVQVDEPTTSAQLIYARDPDGRGWHLEVDDQGGLAFVMTLDDANPPEERRIEVVSGALPFGVWSHVALTVDFESDFFLFWIDGEPSMATSVYNGAATHGAPVTYPSTIIGESPEVVAVDDLLLAGYALPSNEIAVLVDGSTQTSPMGCGACDVWCPSGSVCASGQCDARAATPGLAYAWSFDEGEGVIAADGRASAHAVGVPAWATGQLGTAASFTDGTGALLARDGFGDPVRLLGYVSASTWGMWIKPSGPTVDARLIGGDSGGDGWELATSEDGRLVFRLGGDLSSPSLEAQTAQLFQGATGGPSGPADWTHIAFVYEHTGSAGTVELYVDGVFAATATATYSVADPEPSRLTIGGRLMAAGFDGLIDEVVKYNVILDAGELAALAGATHHVATPSEDLACPPDTASCDGLAWNGCEVDTSTDPENCGRCGVTCSGSCVAGVCLSEVCDNSIDDNGDGDVDCADVMCMGKIACGGAVETDCNDGIDDDADGDTDCADSECYTAPVCVVLNYEARCDDGTDDDGDGDVDCDDTECRGVHPSCAAPSENVCDDVWDNDLDGAMNCADPDCTLDPFCTNGGEPELCWIYGDEDHDGDADCDDPDCAAFWRCGPGSETECDDATDNDADGYTDCDDVDCSGNPACPVGPETECGNFEDDDGDGAPDCSDSDCAGSPPCLNTGATGTAGAACVDASDCVGGVLGSACLPEGFTGVPGGHCAQWCTADGTSGCPAGLHCVVASDNWGQMGLCIDRCLDLDECDVQGGEECRRLGDSNGRPLACRRVCHQNSDCPGTGVCDPAYGGCVYAESEICDNAEDDDGDGLADCADPDCAGIGVCHHASEVGMCADGFDNDGDGFSDCHDSDCVGVSPCLGPEAGNCADGVDNDGDGDTDCTDSDCVGEWGCTGGTQEVHCDDSVDNDGDGDTDCADTDCTGAWGCTGGTQETHCDDSVDNDGDGDTDCADADCVGGRGCTGGSVEAHCGDGVDNDDDTDTDCADSDCATDAACTGGCPAVVDCGLPECAADPSCVTNEAQCPGGNCCTNQHPNGDPIDDDGDGRANCDDVDCMGLDPSCPIREVACADLDDNDDDAAVDCADLDCVSSSACTPSSSVEMLAPCTSHSECSNGAGGAPFCLPFDPEVSSDGECLHTCDLTDSATCESGFDCVDLGFPDDVGMCMPACFDADDCIGTEQCTGFMDHAFGVCVPGCVTDADCDGEEVCDEGTGACDLPVEICWNGSDDDGDGAPDCFDSDCYGEAFCGTEGDGSTAIGQPCSRTDECTAEFGTPFCADMGVAIDGHCAARCDTELSLGEQCGGEESLRCDTFDVGGGHSAAFCVVRDDCTADVDACTGGEVCAVDIGVCIPEPSQAETLCESGDCCANGVDDDRDGRIDCDDRECDGYCRAECLDSSECTLGEVCVRGACESSSNVFEVPAPDGATLRLALPMSVTLPAHEDRIEPLPVTGPDEFFNSLGERGVRWHVGRPGAASITLHFDQFVMAHANSEVRVYSDDNGLQTLEQVFPSAAENGAFWTQEYVGDHLVVELSGGDVPCALMDDANCARLPIWIDQARARVRTESPTIRWNEHDLAPSGPILPRNVGVGFSGTYRMQSPGAQYVRVDVDALHASGCPIDVTLSSGGREIVVLTSPFSASGPTSWVAGDHVEIELRTGAVGCSDEPIDVEALRSEVADIAAGACSLEMLDLTRSVWDGQGGTLGCEEQVRANFLQVSSARNGIADWCGLLSERFGSISGVDSLVSDCETLLDNQCLGPEVQAATCGLVVAETATALVAELPVGTTFHVPQHPVGIESLSPTWNVLVNQEDVDKAIGPISNRAMGLRFDVDHHFEILAGLRGACGGAEEQEALALEACAGTDERITLQPGAMSSLDIHVGDHERFVTPPGAAVAIGTDGVADFTVTPIEPEHHDALACQPRDRVERICEPDPEGDGLRPVERCRGNVNPASYGYDFDSDGLFDFAERCVVGTDVSGARAWDTDSDAIPDGAEVCGIDTTWDLPEGTTRFSIDAQRLVGGPFVRDIMFQSLFSPYIESNFVGVGLEERVQRPLLMGIEPIGMSEVTRWDLEFDDGLGRLTIGGEAVEREDGYESDDPWRGLWFYQKIADSGDPRGFRCACNFTAHSCSEEAARVPDASAEECDPSWLPSLDSVEVECGRGYDSRRPAIDAICAPGEVSTMEVSGLCADDVNEIEVLRADDEPVLTASCAAEPVWVRDTVNQRRNRDGACVTSIGASDCRAVADHSSGTCAPLLMLPEFAEPCRAATQHTLLDLVRSEPASHCTSGLLGLGHLVLFEDCREGEEACVNGRSAPSVCAGFVRIMEGEYGDTLVHELGHSIGLSHAGLDNTSVVPDCDGLPCEADDSRPTFATPYNSVMHGAGWLNDTLTAFVEPRFSSGARGVVDEESLTESGAMSVGSEHPRHRWVEWDWRATEVFSRGWSNPWSRVAGDSVEDPSTHRVAVPRYRSGLFAGRSVPVGEHRTCEEVYCPAGFACRTGLGVRPHLPETEQLTAQFFTPESGPVSAPFGLSSCRRTSPGDSSCQSDATNVALCTAFGPDFPNNPDCCGNGVLDVGEVCETDVNVLTMEGADCFLCRGRRHNVIEEVDGLADGVTCVEVVDGIDWNRSGFVDPVGAPLWRQGGVAIGPSLEGAGWVLSDFCTFSTQLSGFWSDEPGAPTGVWTVPQFELDGETVVAEPLPAPVPFELCTQPQHGTDGRLAMRSALRATAEECWDSQTTRVRWIRVSFSASPVAGRKYSLEVFVSGNWELAEVEAADDSLVSVSESLRRELERLGVEVDVPEVGAGEPWELRVFPRDDLQLEVRAGDHISVTGTVLPTGEECLQNLRQRSEGYVRVSLPSRLELDGGLTDEAIIRARHFSRMTDPVFAYPHRDSDDFQGMRFSSFPNGHPGSATWDVVSGIDTLFAHRNSVSGGLCQ